MKLIGFYPYRLVPTPANVIRALRVHTVRSTLMNAIAIIPARMAPALMRLMTTNATVMPILVARIALYR